MTRMFPNEDDSPELAEAYRALWPTADLQEALLRIAATTLAHEAILVDIIVHLAQVDEDIANKLTTSGLDPAGRVSMGEIAADSYESAFQRIRLTLKMLYGYNLQ